MKTTKESTAKEWYVLIWSNLPKKGLLNDKGGFFFLKLINVLGAGGVCLCFPSSKSHHAPLGCDINRVRSRLKELGELIYSPVC